MTKKATRDVRSLPTGFGDFDFDYIPLKNDQWLIVEGKLQTKISQELREQLSGMTMLYHLGSHVPYPKLSITHAQKDITLWSKRTRVLRNFIWSPRKQSQSKPRPNRPLKSIIADHFHARRTLHTGLFPLAHLAHFLDGAEASRSAYCERSYSNMTLHRNR
jgi:hypothetical protein